MIVLRKPTLKYEDNKILYGMYETDGQRLQQVY